MNKSRVIVIWILIFGLVLSVSGCSNTNNSKSEVVAGALNSSYTIGKDNITLTNGVFEKPAAPGSAAMNRTQVWEQPVIGDLNADGQEDAAICLINTPGGSGTFYYIAAAIRDANTKKFKGTTAVFLGDRIQLSKISIEDNIISVTYNETKADKAMTANPSVAVSKKFKVENGLLKEIVSGARSDTNNTNNSSNKKAAYSLSKIAHKNNNNVFYPQISNYKGELLSGYINQSLKNVADKFVGKDEYTNVMIDYVITRQDDTVLSVLFKGTAESKNRGRFNIMDSVNLDVGKSTNEIRYDNLVQNTDEAKLYLKDRLTQAAKGIKGGFQTDGVRIYFTNTDIVFFYMPPDDSAKGFVELSIPKAELEQYVNHDFGSVPAS